MLSVLVVEDEPLIRLAAADTLMSAGYRVLEAGDADEALAILRAQPRLDAMVTDVRMPGSMDGLALARSVVRHYPETGVLITSGHAHLTASDLPAGVTFLAKPYRSVALKQKVAEIIAARREGAAQDRALSG